MSDVIAALISWIHSASVRLEAQERSIRDRVQVSDEEWSKALSDAREVLWMPDHESADPNLKGLALVEGLLKHLTK
jgi:hypothetical protein